MKRRFINLLTWRVRFYLLWRERLFLWSIVWGVCCVIAIGLWQVKSHRTNGDADALALMESRCQPLTLMQAENKQMSKRLNELHSHQSLLTRLDDEQVPYRMMGLVSHSVAACDDEIRVQKMTLARSREEIQAKTPKTAPKKKTVRPVKPAYREVTVLTLNGIAADNIAISRFVASLRDSGIFESVDLKSSVGARVDAERAQSYLVECKYF